MLIGEPGRFVAATTSSSRLTRAFFRGLPPACNSPAGLFEVSPAGLAVVLVAAGVVTAGPVVVLVEAGVVTVALAVVLVAAGVVTAGPVVVLVEPGVVGVVGVMLGAEEVVVGDLLDSFSLVVILLGTFA